MGLGFAGTSRRETVLAKPTATSCRFTLLTDFRRVGGLSGTTGSATSFSTPTPSNRSTEKRVVKNEGYVLG